LSQVSYDGNQSGPVGLTNETSLLWE
jgi:hypothetical protein